MAVLPLDVYLQVSQALMPPTPSITACHDRPDSWSVLYMTSVCDSFSINKHHVK
jgi:hypothetical protein